MSFFFSSDLHLSHNKDFIYAARGFSSIEEHDKTIIDNINNSVREEDTLFLLGDLIVGDNNKGMEYLRSINCQDVRVILGNHDTPARVELYKSLPNFSVLGYSYLWKKGKKTFLLSHYPTLTQNMDDDKKPWQKVWNICGHSHTKQLWDPITGSYHVELDTNLCCPVSYEELVVNIREKRGKYD